MDQKNFCQYCYYKFRVFKYHSTDTCKFNLSSKLREENKRFLDKKLRLEFLNKPQNYFSLSKEPQSFLPPIDKSQILNFPLNKCTPNFFRGYLGNSNAIVLKKNDLIKNVLNCVNSKIEKNQNIILKKLESLEQQNITLEKSIRKVLSPKILQDTDNKSEKIRLNLIKKKKEIEKSLKNLNNSTNVKAGTSKFIDSSSDESCEKNEDSSNLANKKPLKCSRKKVLKKKVLQDNEKKYRRYSSSSNESNTNLNNHLDNITESVGNLRNSVSKFNSIVDNLDSSANKVNDSLNNFGDLITNLNSSLNFKNELAINSKTDQNQSMQKNILSTSLCFNKNKINNSPNTKINLLLPSKVLAEKDNQLNDSISKLKNSSENLFKSKYTIIDLSKNSLNNDEKICSDEIKLSNKNQKEIVLNNCKKDNSSSNKNYDTKNDNEILNDKNQILNKSNESNKVSTDVFDKENSVYEEKNDKSINTETNINKDDNILKEHNRSNEMVCKKLKEKIKDKLINTKNEVRKVKLIRKKIKKDRLKRKLKKRALIKKNLLSKKIKKISSELKETN